MTATVPIRNDGKGCPCWFSDMGMEETGCRRVVLHIVPSCEHHWPLVEDMQPHALAGLTLDGPGSAPAPSAEG